MVRRGVRTVVTASAMAAGAVAGCAHTREQPLPPASAVPYRAATETVDVAPSEWPRLYRPVLRFYGPPSNQARWLDRQLLPATPGDSAGPLLDPATARALVAASDVERLCVRDDAAAACDRALGGVLRLSAPFAPDSTTARVAVRFELVSGPGAPGTAYSGTQVFLLRRQSDGWTIVGRGAADGGRD